MNQLLEKIDRHVGQMSPHIRERLTVQLLIEARDRLRQLQFESLKNIEQGQESRTEEQWEEWNQPSGSGGGA